MTLTPADIEYQARMLQPVSENLIQAQGYLTSAASALTAGNKAQCRQYLERAVVAIEAERQAPSPSQDPQAYASALDAASGTVRNMAASLSPAPASPKVKATAHWLAEENTLSLMLSNPSHVLTVCDDVAELSTRLSAPRILDAVPWTGDPDSPHCCWCGASPEDVLLKADYAIHGDPAPQDWACTALDPCLQRHSDYWDDSEPVRNSSALAGEQARLDALRSALSRWLAHSHYHDSVLEPPRAPRPLPAYDDTIWALSAPSGPSQLAPRPVLAGLTIAERAVQLGTWKPPEEPKPVRKVRHRPRKPYR